MVDDVKMTMSLVLKMAARARARRVIKFATPGETLAGATDRIALMITQKAKAERVVERKVASLELQTS